MNQEQLEAKKLNYAPEGLEAPVWRVTLRHWLFNKWQRWKCRNTIRATRDLSKALQTDPGYWVSWQANFSMVIYDASRVMGTPGESISASQCNYLADKIMVRFFNAPRDERHPK